MKITPANLLLIGFTKLDGDIGDELHFVKPILIGGQFHTLNVMESPVERGMFGACFEEMDIEMVDGIVDLVSFMEEAIAHPRDFLNI